MLPVSTAFIFSAAADQSHLLIGSDKRTLTNNNNTGIGILSVANGNSTVAVGYEARASANYSIAIGAYSRAYADDSIVIGENSEITDTDWVVWRWVEILRW